MGSGTPVTGSQCPLIRGLVLKLIAVMTRRKVNTHDKLSKKIGLRVSEPFYEKLKSWLSASNCRSIAELTRKILHKEKITLYHKNAELESVAIQLSLIRKELNAIGRNINQVTRQFHSASPHQKTALALKITAENQKVGEKVAALLEITGQIAAKWLSR